MNNGINCLQGFSTFDFALENLRIDIEAPIGFTQIKCEASKEQILNYFMILTKEKNHLNGKIYMSEADPAFIFLS